MGNKLQLRKKNKKKTRLAVNVVTGKQDKSHGCAVQSHFMFKKHFLHFVYDAKISMGE